MSFARDHALRLAALVALALASVPGPARAQNPASPMPASPTPASRTPARLPAIVGATERQASDGRSGLGLSGYDPVSYGIDGEPRPGLARHEAVLGGLAWRFASEANRQAFLRDPDAFLPRTGGYDASQAADGRVAAADPLVFLVRAGRLYLFRSPEGRARFLADPAAPAAAERNWERLRAGLVRG